MSATKYDQQEGEIHSQHVAPVEHPPSYQDATHPRPGGNFPMQGPPGSSYPMPGAPPGGYPMPGAPPGGYPMPAPHYPTLPPASDIPMQPYPGSAPNYGSNQPYPNAYNVAPVPMQQPSPYNNMGFTDINAQQPQPMPNAPGDYNYPKNYVVVQGDQNRQDRRDSDNLDCCKCLLCCCGCIELCRCLGMCLKCMTDD